MTQLANQSLQARKQVRLRFRRNLQVVPQQEGAELRYVVKDPVSLRYYRFDARQRFVVALMDGTVTLEEIQRAYEQSHAPDRLSLEQLEVFAAQLVNNGLATNDSPQAASLLWSQTQRQRRDKRRQRWLNFLSIKVPLYDPDVLLSRLTPWLGGLFSPWGMGLGLALVLFALAVVLGHWSAFVWRLPSYGEFFTPATILWLWIAYVLVKMAHEFGHALCCRALGGEVHEMGVLFVLFTPMLYCNVTDAWKLPGCWQRIGVSAAGVYVELLLASLATLLWWITDSTSLAHALAFSVMVVCGISTFVVNANPLLRFDGYYALSDWLDMPNLSETSQRVLRSVLLRWFGVAMPRETQVRRRWFACLYALASSIYRWVVLAATLYVFSLFLQPYRLRVLCLLAALASLATGLFWPLGQLGLTLLRQRRLGPMKWSRVALVLLLVFSVGIVVVQVPLRQSVSGQGLLQVEPGDSVRVAIPDSGGFLGAIRVEDGQFVQEGQILTVLTNPQVRIALRLNETEQQLRQQQERSQIAWLTETRGAENGLSIDVEQTRFEMKGLSRQNGILRQQVERLVLRAPRSGKVLGLQPRDQVGKWLERGTELCRIGDVRAMRVVLLVEPADHQRLVPGSPARVRMHGCGDREWAGVVSEIALVDARSIPPQLSSRTGGEVATRQDPLSNQETPSQQHYLVSVRLAETGAMLHPGGMARVRIEAESRTLWWQFRRWLTLTLNLGL